MRPTPAPTQIRAMPTIREVQNVRDAIRRRRQGGLSDWEHEQLRFLDAVCVQRIEELQHGDSVAERTRSAKQALGIEAGDERAQVQERADDARRFLGLRPTRQQEQVKERAREVGKSLRGR